MRNVSEKFVAKFKHTFYAQRYFPENRAVYEIMWKNMVQPDRPQIWYSQTGRRYGTARQATYMVQPDRPQIWYSQTGHRYGTARQATDMVQPDRPQIWYSQTGHR